MFVSHIPVHKYVDSLLLHSPMCWAQCFVFSLSGKSGKRGKKKKKKRQKWPKNTKLKKKKSTFHINALFLKKKKKCISSSVFAKCMWDKLFFLNFFLFALYFKIFLFVGATSGNILQQCYSCPCTTWVQCKLWSRRSHGWWQKPCKHQHQNHSMQQAIYLWDR